MSGSPRAGHEDTGALNVFVGHDPGLRSLNIPLSGLLSSFLGAGSVVVLSLRPAGTSILMPWACTLPALTTARTAAATITRLIRDLPLTFMRQAGCRDGSRRLKPVTAAFSMSSSYSAMREAVAEILA